ncbi:capsular biosynthesis protein [Helicobacter sp. T3_23-1056]
MKHNNQTLIIDLDGTITIDDNLPYPDKRPNTPLINKLKFYKKRGFKIVIFTSRAMRTYNGDLEQIKANTLPEILKWLEKHKIPYDEVIIGKAWCGERGFYVDDRAIRPSEFENLSLAKITQLLEKEKEANLAKSTPPTRSTQSKPSKKSTPTTHPTKSTQDSHTNSTKRHKESK